MASSMAGRAAWDCLIARPIGVELEPRVCRPRGLLHGVDEALLAGLPTPQRRALAVALLHESHDGTPADELAVGAAFLGVLRRLAVKSPLLVAVDDVQWLDPASARLLGFALRKLNTEQIGALLTYRLGEDSARPRLVGGPQRRSGTTGWPSVRSLWERCTSSFGRGLA